MSETETNSDQSEFFPDQKPMILVEEIPKYLVPGIAQPGTATYELRDKVDSVLRSFNSGGKYRVVKKISEDGQEYKELGIYNVLTNKELNEIRDYSEHLFSSPSDFADFFLARALLEMGHLVPEERGVCEHIVDNLKAKFIENTLIEIFIHGTIIGSVNDTLIEEDNRSFGKPPYVLSEYLRKRIASRDQTFALTDEGKELINIALSKISFDNPKGPWEAARRILLDYSLAKEKSQEDISFERLLMQTHNDGFLYDKLARTTEEQKLIYYLIVLKNSGAFGLRRIWNKTSREFRDFVEETGQSTYFELRKSFGSQIPDSITSVVPSILKITNDTAQDIAIKSVLEYEKSALQKSLFSICLYVSGLYEYLPKPSGFSQTEAVNPAQIRELLKRLASDERRRNNYTFSQGRILLENSAKFFGLPDEKQVK